MDVAGAGWGSAECPVVAFSRARPVLDPLPDFVLVLTPFLVTGAVDRCFLNVVHQGIASEGTENNAVAGDRLQQVVGLSGASPTLLHLTQQILLPCFYLVLVASGARTVLLAVVGDRLLQFVQFLSRSSGVPLGEELSQPTADGLEVIVK